MTEEKEKPKELTFKVKIPTKDTIIKALQSMFPIVEVEVVEEKEEEKPSESED